MIAPRIFRRMAGAWSCWPVWRARRSIWGKNARYDATADGTPPGRPPLVTPVPTPGRKIKARLFYVNDDGRRG